MANTRNILISGGTGFIGKYLVNKHVCKGDKVFVFSRKKIKSDVVNLQYIKFDLQDLDNKKKFERYFRDADIFYHLAAETTNEEIMFETNVMLTKKFLNFALMSNLKWVQLSSVGVYGYRYDGIISEKTSECPSSLYEITKTIADKLLIDASLEKSLDLVILRPSNVYGETMKNKSLFQLINQIKQGLFFFVGPKGASANYVHVDDVTNALIACAETSFNSYKIFNLSNWDSFENMVYKICQEFDRPKIRLRIPFKIIYIGAKIISLFSKTILTPSRVLALSSRAIYSNDLITQELNFKPEISVQSGISRLIKAWHKN